MNETKSDDAEDFFNCVRQCSKCKGKMQVKGQEEKDSDFSLRDRFTRFICNNCKQEVLIAEPVTVITGLIAGLGILLVLIYALMNGFLYFLAYNLSATIGFKLLAIFLGLLFALFVIGAGLNLKNSFLYLLKQYTHPVLKGRGSSRSLTVTLLLGILPWLIAVGLGYINYQLFDDNELFGLLALPIILGPIFLAPTFKITYMAVFFASAFWGCLAGFAAWIF